MSTKRTTTIALGTGLILGLTGSLLIAAASVPTPEPTEPVQTVWTDTEPTPEPTSAPQTAEPEPEAPTEPEPAPEPVTEPQAPAPQPPTDYPHDVTEDQAVPGTEPAPIPVTPVPEPEPTDWRAVFEAEGHVVGDVIVCPPGLSVAIDEYDDGTTWASCQ